MINWLRSFFLTLSTILVFNAKASIHPMETTHLKSQGGSGVASILVEETAFLNPAPIIFFNTSTVFYQHDSLSISDTNGGNYPKKKANAFVLAQGEPNFGGTLSFYDQTEDQYRRKSMAFSLAAPVGKVSSFGISVRRNQDDNQLLNTSKKYYQTVLGVSHIISENTTLGIVFYDPFKSYAKETKAILGLQQNIATYISGNFDVGANYDADELSKTLLLRGGIQVKVLDDFYLRVGGFNDKARIEKGESFGIAWIQPKLAFEFAIKTTKNNSLSYEIKNRETSFSISMRGF